MQSKRNSILIGLILFIGVLNVTIQVRGDPEDEGYRLMVYKKQQIIRPGDTFNVSAQLFLGTHSITDNITMKIHSMIDNIIVLMNRTDNQSVEYFAPITIPFNYSFSSFRVIASAYYTNITDSIAGVLEIFEISSDFDEPRHLLSKKLVSWGETFQLQTYLPNYNEESLDETTIEITYALFPYYEYSDYFPDLIKDTMMIYYSPTIINATYMGNGLFETNITVPEKKDVPIHHTDNPTITAYVHTTIEGQEFINIYGITVGEYYMYAEGVIKDKELELTISAYTESYNSLTGYNVSVEISQNLKNSTVKLEDTVEFQDVNGTLTFTYSLDDNCTNVHVYANTEYNGFVGRAYVSLLSDDFYVIEDVSHYLDYYSYLSTGIAYSFKAYYQKNPLMNDQLTVYIKSTDAMIAVYNTTTDTAGAFSVKSDWLSTMNTGESFMVDFAYYNGELWVKSSDFYRTVYNPAFVIYENQENLTLQYKDSINGSILSVIYKVPTGTQFVILDMNLKVSDEGQYSNSLESDFSLINKYGRIPSEDKVEIEIVLENNNNLKFLFIHAEVFGSTLSDYQEIIWLISSETLANVSNVSTIPTSSVTGVPALLYSFIVLIGMFLMARYKRINK